MFVPRKTILCERRLQVNVYPCDMLFGPLNRLTICPKKFFISRLFLLYFHSYFNLHFSLFIYDKLEYIFISFYQELGVLFANIEEYPLELIPLDNDVLSLEMDSCFKVDFS